MALLATKTPALLTTLHPLCSHSTPRSTAPCPSALALLHCPLLFCRALLHCPLLFCPRPAPVQYCPLARLPAPRSTAPLPFSPQGAGPRRRRHHLARGDAQHHRELLPRAARRRRLRRRPPRRTAPCQRTHCPETRGHHGSSPRCPGARGRLASGCPTLRPASAKHPPLGPRGPATLCFNTPPGFVSFRTLRCCRRPSTPSPTTSSCSHAA